MYLVHGLQSQLLWPLSLPACTFLLSAVDICDFPKILQCLHWVMLSFALSQAGETLGFITVSAHSYKTGKVLFVVTTSMGFMPTLFVAIETDKPVLNWQDVNMGLQILPAV